jgi:hypothetical protein
VQIFQGLSTDISGFKGRYLKGRMQIFEELSVDILRFKCRYLRV